MRDYIVNTKGKRMIIEGNDNYSRSDFEYWKFVYIENTWLLSNILRKMKWVQAIRSYIERLKMPMALVI
mgnify:CR=1 FL=1